MCSKKQDSKLQCESEEYHCTYFVLNCILSFRMTVPYDTLELIPMTSNVENHNFADTFTDLSFKGKF